MIVVVDSVVNVVVNVDIVVNIVVDVVVDDSVVVAFDDVVVVVTLSGFVGERMTNFNNRGRVIAIIAKTIKETPMIFTRR